MPNSVTLSFTPVSTSKLKRMLFLRRTLRTTGILIASGCLLYLFVKLYLGYVPPYFFEAIGGGLLFSFICTFLESIWGLKFNNIPLATHEALALLDWCRRFPLVGEYCRVIAKQNRPVYKMDYDTVFAFLQKQGVMHSSIVGTAVEQELKQHQKILLYPPSV